MRHAQSRKQARQARHIRVRKKIQGTAERPRMNITFTNRNMTVQFIDDQAERTLASVSTASGNTPGGMSGAEALGKQAAEKATSAGIQSAVVDRGGFRYHGRLKAIVESANQAGLAVGAVAAEKVEEEA